MDKKICETCIARLTWEAVAALHEDRIEDLIFLLANPKYSSSMVAEVSNMLANVSKDFKERIQKVKNIYPEQYSYFLKRIAMFLI